MSLIAASNVGKSFGPNDLFSGVTLEIPRRARIALVGPNGIGKTTLLRILAGFDQPSTGKVFRARDLNIGFLPQEAELDATHTLWEECLNPFEDLLSLERRLSEIEAQLGDSENGGELLERYGKLQETFEQRGGYEYELNIRKILSGLGFGTKDHQRPLTKLSGGQKTRAFLARLLLSSNDVLILDEPTNHLDLSAVEWLEGYLKDWEGAVLIVSHDRYFIDRVIDTIWEMSPIGTEIYRGNYSQYLQERQIRWENRRKAFDSEISRLEKDLDYIRRNIAGQNTVQAKGRLRRLSRIIEAAEKGGGLHTITGKKWMEISDEISVSRRPMGVDEAGKRLKSLTFPSQKPLPLNLKLKPTERSGNIILRTERAEIGYTDDPLFIIKDLELRRLECAAVVGPNGAGKTTLLKTIMEEVKPISGALELGASLRIGYFAQAHEDLVPERTLMESIDSVAPNLLPKEIRSHLARFMFRGDDVFKQVKVLSGGERGRLALAKLALSDANFLLLDEPTNHLDIPAQEILQSVLTEFDGTIVFVSHDRFLIDALATQIWFIDTQNRCLDIFKGSYTAYKSMVQSETSDFMDGNQMEIPVSMDDVQPQRPGLSKNELYRRQRRITELEIQIDEIELQVEHLSVDLSQKGDDPRVIQGLGSEYKELQRQLDLLITEWEKLQSEINPDQ